jgi:hypothetical protein
MVLTTFIPMQLYAANLSGFNSDTQIEYFVPRGPSKAEENEQKFNEKMQENPPKNVDGAKSGVNWWLWGALGLVVVGGGTVALIAGGSKGGGSTGSTTSTVIGSW